MTYQINSIFYTVQGEGYWSGRAAIFIRFSRCNLWTGREADRARAVCQFCDTDFTASQAMTAEEIEARVAELTPSGLHKPMIVFTGAEPLLQLDYTLASRLYDNHYLAVETNGTTPFKTRVWCLVNWVCVSPKANAPLAITQGDELKLVYPQGPDPSVYLALDFKHFWLSPMDGPDVEKNTRLAYERVLADPRWRLNTQTHKQIGVQ